MLLFDIFIILIHQFVFPFSVLSQKEKFYVKRKNNTQSSCMIFFRILCRMDIYFKRLIIYQSVAAMNINNRLYVTVLSNLQFKLIFSVLKKSYKNDYICPSDMCLFDIITSSSISLIIFSMEDFFVS